MGLCTLTDVPRLIERGTNVERSTDSAVPRQLNYRLPGGAGAWLLRLLSANGLGWVSVARSLPCRELPRRRPRKLRAMALTMPWVIDRRAGLRLRLLRD